MLLEKALAKLCGGYSNIPDDPLEIMEMIYCGILIRHKELQLKETEENNKTIM